MVRDKIAPVLAGVAAMLVTCVCSWGDAAAQTLSADPSGAALEVAAAELATYPALYSDVPGRSPFPVADRSMLERATLGEPFRCYWPDSTFAEYENADSSTLLDYLVNVCVSFPVHSDGRILGTINVQFGADSSYSTTRFIGEGLVEQYLRQSAVAPVQTGQRTSVIQSTIGEYVVVEDGTTISRMIPLNAARGTNWLSPQVVAPEIRAAIAARREAKQKEEQRSQATPNSTEDQ